MTFKPALWYPIAVGLSVVNVLAVWFAAEPAGLAQWHAMGHAALAVGFGWWAHRLRQRAQGGELQAGLEALEIEVSALRQELGETQERLDFAERMLARETEPLRMDPERESPRHSS
jgi:hypothetical protein